MAIIPSKFSDADKATAYITARDNTYDNTSGVQETGGGGTPFNDAPYDANIEPASGIPAVVKSCAGPH